MKKLVVLAVVALLGFGTASAQQRGGRQHGMSVEEQVNKLKKDLNLSDEQTKKVTALYTDFQKKMKESGEDSREKMREEREKLNKEVENLLTDEQKTAYKKQQAERRGGGRPEKKK